ncbi:hypothetical protein KAH27_11070 [bacterium]|nr:hypothetical protein [bacterium]
MRKYLGILTLFTLYACSAYYYFPTYQNVPIPTKKHEFKQSYFINGESQGFSLSYSISNNFGVFSNLNTFDNYKFSSGAYFTDFGLFIYKNPFPSDDKVKMIISLASAYGYGQNNRYSEYYDMGIHRIFIQPALYFTNDFFDIGFSYRFSYVNYTLNINGDRENNGNFDELFDIGSEPFYFSEPHFFIGLGYKWVKISYHLVSAHKINDAKIQYYKSEVPYLSLDIKFNIDKIFNK